MFVREEDDRRRAIGELFGKALWVDRDLRFERYFVPSLVMLDHNCYCSALEWGLTDGKLDQPV